jgi:membrane fusion protein, multidrug efflux system
MQFWKILGSLLLVLCVIAGASALGYWKYKQIDAAMKAPPPPEQAESVSAFLVTNEKWRPTTHAVGTVFATRSVVLKNERAGVVSEVHVESGQLVKAGDVLGAFDSSVEEAELAEQVAKEKQARSTVERINSVRGGSAVAAEESDKARAELEQITAKRKQIEVVISKKKLRAPFTGRLGLRRIHPGQYLNEGTEITTLQGTDPEVHIDFSLPQALAGMTKPGTTVTIGDGIVGKVLASEAVIQEATRNVRVRSLVPNADGKLIPGMAVDVRISSGTDVDVLVIPAQAVRRQAHGDHVFLLEDAGDEIRAKQRTVVLGQSIGEKIVVVKGLKLGERVAADGSFKLREGSKVEIAASTPPAAPATEKTPEKK